MKAFDESNIQTTVESIYTADNTDWHRLGFDSPAFEDNQHGHYFPIDSWEDALGDLEVFCEGKDPLLVIPSIPGSGKTTFLHRFISTQDAPGQIHYLKARSIFSLRHLLNAVSENIPQFRNKSSNAENFITDLRALARESGPQLLIIDDAQRLAKETLAGLLQIVASQDLSNLWLRVVLSGEPQLEESVQNLYDELEFAFTFNTIVLDSLDIVETRAYLKHRLDEAGFAAKFPFNKSMVKHIHTLSSGFPGRINRVAQQVLIDMGKNHQLANKQNSNFSGVWSKYKLHLISLITLCVSAWIFWYLQQPYSPLRVRERNAAAPQFEGTANRSPDSQDRVPTNEQSENATPVETPRQNISLSEQQTMQTDIPIPQENDQDQHVSVTVSENIPAETQSTESQSVEAKSPAQPITATASTPVAPTPAQASAPSSVPVTTQAPTPAPVSSVQAPKPVPAPVPAAVPAPIVKSVAPVSSIKQPLSLQSVKPTLNPGFTLQLIGVHDKAKLLDYIKQLHLGNKAAYYQTDFHGNPWYVLTYGQFKTADEAHEAIKALPATIQALNPFVKPMSVISSPLIR